MWPTASEREVMKTEKKVLYGFQNCIEIIDGTIVILDKRPSYYGDSYWCRKQCYSMNLQVVCDHKGRITYLVGGWPGSVHDNRAWRNCSLFVNADPEIKLHIIAKHLRRTPKKIGGSRVSKASSKSI